MSLNAFKETLKPCTNQLSLSSSQNPSTFTQFDSPIITRKPPKSSLAQQLLRLENPSYLPENQPKSPKKDTFLAIKPKTDNEYDEYEEEEAEDQKKEKRIVFGGPKLENKPLVQTGPYEPLVLSSAGEIPVVQVPASINCRLLEHQREGVKFLYNLYKNNHGGILGDDMGLGKTIQTIAFLSAIFQKDPDSETGNKICKKGLVLIICPSSVIQNWVDEFSKWSTFNVSIYHGQNRDIILEKLDEILVTSFDTFRIHEKTLSPIKWNIVIIDEAHRLKNDKSKFYIACKEIKTKHRYGLTGTVIQNNLTELFNVLDWAAPGCLGYREHFREYYDEPLKQGQRLSAPERFTKIAKNRQNDLNNVTKKYLLRRTKEETIGHLMKGKEDNIVFCGMSEVQKRVYKRTLELPEFQCLINKDLPCKCGSPLKQVECCNRIVPNGVIWPYLHRDNPDGCDNCPFCLVLPCLNKLQQISNHLELIKPNPRDEPEKQKKDEEFAIRVFGTDLDLVGGNIANTSFMGLSDVKHCGKMRALENLMVSWMLQGDKVLLFSSYVRMLDILEKFLIRKGYCFSRLDGSTPTSSRQSLVDDFNFSPSKQVFLISTRAGGLGLNLVSANRVVVFDPNWNPAHDLQAQDRSFRFGQKRHVVVFRLLGGGTLEELIYTRQVYKQQLANIATSGKMEKRYFEGVQNSKDFQGELFGISNLFRDLSEKQFTSEIIESQGAKQEIDKLGMYFLPPQETNKSKPVLEELGILYAHRNEHIVNYGISKGENGILSNLRKRKQFTRVAKFMGMKEIEFSKWLLNASQMEREKVVEDYKKRRF